jgi:hypothetical protein
MLDCETTFLTTSKPRTYEHLSHYMMSSDTSEPRAFPPVISQYSGDKLVVGGGVAIFHIASGRVAGEESGTGAEREGYEEVRTHNCSSAGYSLTRSPRAAIATVVFPYLQSIASQKDTPGYTRRR